MAALLPGGCLEGLAIRRESQPALLDLQLRRAGRRSWVSLYAGLSSVVDIDEVDDMFRVRSHPTYRRIGNFDPVWSKYRSAEAVAADWAAVDSYLEAVLNDESVLPRFTRREGRVHAAMSSGIASAYRLVQREAVIAHRSASVRSELLDGLQTQIHDAMRSGGRVDAWWPGVRDRGVMPRLGNEVDVLAIDHDGRLLVVEVKPYDEIKGIAWSPAQVLVYAELFGYLVEDDAAIDALDGMLTQRVAIGLDAPGPLFARPLRVTPVVAIGAEPSSPRALERLQLVAQALPDAAWSKLAPLEVWILDEHGEVHRRWLPLDEPLPAKPGTTVAISRSERMQSFVALARAAAVQWKTHTSALPESARHDAPYRGFGVPYPFCLPVAESTLNLLPEARDVALSRFAAAGIPWHHGIGVGPSNHLLSSQVQCANCLAPLVDKPELLTQLLCPVLPIERVLPFGAETDSRYDAHDHVVFEWIGKDDYLGERGHGNASRGANTTSADAAIRYRTPDGRIEIALIEWKYTERYLGTVLSGDESKMRARHERYRHFWDNPDGPLRTDLIPYDDLFVEPFYQLMRLQVLAHEMQQHHDQDAAVVRLVVVAPSANFALNQSFNRPSQHIEPHFGTQHLPEVVTVWDAWKAMQRNPDHFGVLDSALLVTDDAPTNSEFKQRYGHLALTPAPDVLTARPTVVSSEAVRGSASVARWSSIDFQVTAVSSTNSNS